MALTDWGRRCALVIQSGQVTDNEVNFPLLVTEDTLPSEIFDADGSYPALNGGGDIRFSSDEAGNTQLACEIESFITDNDPVNGKAAIWVKVPSLSSSSNTTIYIWYNKAGESQPAEDNAYGKENVWDSNFVMVQHMNQTPDGTADEIVDSTSNDNDGTTYGGMDSADQVAGQVDGSLDFDGDNDYVDVGSDVSLTPTDEITLSMWLKPYTTVSTEQNIFRELHDGADGGKGYILGGGWTSGKFRGYLYTGSYISSGDSTTTIEANNLYYVGITYNKNDGSNQFKLYVNGINENSGSSANTIQYGGKNLLIGMYDTTTTDYPFNGSIDEVRISNVARSAGWIATEYNNQKVPWTFLIEGTPETPGAAPITFIPQIIMF